MRSSLLLVPAAAATLVLGLAGCAPALVAGPQVTEERDIDAASAFVLDTAADVEITVGEPRLVIHAPQAALDRTTTEISDGTLKIGTRPGPSFGVADLRIELSLPDLSVIELNGSGDIDWEGVDVDRLELSINGSGGIEVAGSATELSIALDGSGDIDAEDVRGEDALVEISGSGEVEVTVSERLTVDISGSGDVRYHGDPETTIDVSGSGDVSRA